jgi:hypothetical protein
LTKLFEGLNVYVVWFYFDQEQPLCVVVLYDLNVGMLIVVGGLFCVVFGWIRGNFIFCVANSMSGITI